MDPIQGGSRNTPSCFMLLQPEISAGLMSHLARMQTCCRLGKITFVI